MDLVAISSSLKYRSYMQQTRAGIYVRISQDKGGKGLGVARQETACRKLAAQRGWEVVEVFKDNDTSAHATKRPGFDLLTEAIKHAEIDALLIWDQDRLIRKPVELEGFIDLINLYGTEVAAVTGYIDFSSPSGRGNARIRGTFAKMESEQLSIRIKAKQQEIRAAGRSTAGGRAFGFEPNGIAHREAEAAMIQDATARLLQGSSLAAIIHEWNQKGVQTARGGEWRTQSLKVTLTRWRNAGLVQFRGEPVGAAAWDPIVPEEDLRALRTMLSDPARRTNQAGTARKHMLSGLPTCEKTGHPMRWGASTTRAGLVYELYQCTGKGCRLAVIKDAAEEAVIDHIAARLAFPDSDLVALTKDERGRISELRHALAKLDQEEKETEVAKISTRSKLLILEDLQEQRARANFQLDRLTQRNALTALMLDLTPVVQGKKASITAAVKAREEVRQKFLALDLDRKQAVIKALCTITVKPHPKGVRPTPEIAKQRVIVIAVQLV